MALSVRLCEPRADSHRCGRWLGARGSPWPALALDFDTVVAVPLLAVLSFITLLGIAVMTLYPALLLAGYVVGVLFIARLAQTALGKGTPGSFAATPGFFALALLLVRGVASVPFVGAPAMDVGRA